MGIVKAISGHTGARGVMRYLERDGRALARDFLNIGAPIEGWEGDLPRYGACDWAAEMDSVREAAGNGRAWRGRAARTWKHYVLSPDPGSRVDLSTLRGLAVEWASEHFPDHQVAIVYHDDNEGRIPHAHVVVNNTSLETGRRLQVPDPLELNRSFQRLEAERGLPHLSNEPLARPTARARRSRGERAAEARGERSLVPGHRLRREGPRRVPRGVPLAPRGHGGRARRRRKEGAQEGLGVLPRRQPPRGASAGSASASTTEGRPSAPPSSAGPLPSTAARRSARRGRRSPWTAARSSTGSLTQPPPYGGAGRAAWRRSTAWPRRQRGRGAAGRRRRSGAPASSPPRRASSPRGPSGRGGASPAAGARRAPRAGRRHGTGAPNRLAV